MKKFIFSAFLLLLAIEGKSQIDYLRYNDDFNYLKKDSISKTGIEHLKFIPLGDAYNISFGGEVREQIQYYRNPNFGDQPQAVDPANTFQLLHRAMAHMNIEVGKKTRVFMQASSTFRVFNPNPPAPEIDENHLSLHQLFGEHKMGKWLLRVGRQELSYGSHRLITFREGPNTRLSFDGAIANIRSDRRKVDFLALSPVISRKGVFDDGSLKDLIIGGYATENVHRRLLLVDYYFLHTETKRRRYNNKEGSDRRQIAGIRTFSQNEITNYELEATYQFGNFNQLSINAFSLSADVNIGLLPKDGLIAGLSGNYISGDRSNIDDELNTYSTLFSKPQYGLTAPVGATNIITLNPYFRTRLFQKANVLTGTYFMWRQSAQDGMYSPDGSQLRPRLDHPPSFRDKGIGTLLLLEANYPVNNRLSFALDISHFLAGSFIKQTGAGKDISYVGFKASYKF